MDTPSGTSVRNYNAEHLDEDCQNLSGYHENELFWNCTFKKLCGLTLKDCVLTRSKFLTDDVKDALGFTWTLECLTVKDVELSPLLFDLVLVMLIKSSGNTERRKKLVEVLGKQRLLELLQEIHSLER